MNSNINSIVNWIYHGARTVKSFPWDCPYCGRSTTITQNHRVVGNIGLGLENAHGTVVTVTVFVVCPNPECEKFTLSILLFDATRSSTSPRDYFPTEFPPQASWQLVPASEAKVFPDYVPKAIRDDYEEAILIRDLSPKASSTLARRCLQGMIRDFWSIRKGRLKDEIDAIEDKVAPKTWLAIDAVRGVGNIGAHMEKDINVIVEVEPREAAMLIGLIEYLVEDWYVTDHERDQQLGNIIALGEEKQQARKPPPQAEGIDES